MSLIRYAGSKEKLAKQIISTFPDEMSLPLWMNHNRWEYREPFFGAGAIGFKILDRLPPGCSAWINDKDYALICLWHAVWRDPERLSQKVKSYEPRTEDYYKFKEEDGEQLIPIEAGFRKLVLHMTSFGGLGYKSGGPLGGKGQTNDLYPLDCRWNVASLLYDIAELNQTFRKIPNLRITNRDYSDLIDDDPKAFIYLDPPYYEKGKDLYKHYLENEDHVKLADSLKYAKNWRCSYDNHPKIKELYQDWCDMEIIETIYTLGISKSKRRKNEEILISPKVNPNA